MPLPKSIRRKSGVRKLDTESLFQRLSPPPLPPVLRRHGITKLPLAVSITAFLAVVAIIVGTLAAQSMQRDDDLLRADLNRTQQALLSRIQQLENVVSCVRNSGDVAPTSASLPVTVTASELNGLKARIDPAAWNTDAPTETVEYRDTTRGISMRLPSNPKWGNAMYKVAPYETETNTDGNSVITFGPISPKQDHKTFYRKFSIIIRSSLASPTTERGYENDVTLRAKNVGGFEVTTATLSDGSGELLFQGKKYSYAFREVRNDTKNSAMSYQMFPLNDAATLSILRSLHSI